MQAVLFIGAGLIGLAIFIAIVVTIPTSDNN